MKLFIKQVIAFILILTTLEVLGQSNGGFEDNDADGCRNSTGTNTISPFNKGKVPNWNASHGTPQIQKDGCSSGQGDVHSGSEAVFMAYTSSNKEGIFQDISIKKDESFNVALFARGPNSKVVIKFTKNLTNSDGSNAASIPNPSSQQLVIEQSLTNTWQEVRVDEIIADADYSQVWIYSLDGTILVDDFSFFKSCCEPFKLWQNITNPPSTYVNNYIVAGEDITSSQPKGKVIIKADAELTEFHAGQSIELLPGFETEPGAQFSAEIKDCGEKEFEAEIIPLNDFLCNNIYVANACYGSGVYSYSWDNGFGWSLGSGSSIEVVKDKPQWLFLNATDNVTQKTIRKGIHIPASPFSGKFSIDWSNIITPNGDGLNDEWIAIDSSKIDKDSFGYNAYKYDLSIFNRWGRRIHNSSGYDRRKGFRFDEIQWIEDYCSEYTSGTYYGVLTLTNCSFEKTFEFSVFLYCSDSNSEPAPLDIDELGDDKKPELLVFPNPNNGHFEVVLSQQMDHFLVDVLDLNGKVVLSNIERYNSNSLAIDGSMLDAGVYIVRIMNENGQIGVRRIIKQ